MTTSRASRRARQLRRDAGVTFIEMLVTMVLLGLASIAVLTAIAATVRATATHDRVATAQAQLADAGDVLSDAIYVDGVGDPYYIDCALPAQYDALLAAPEWAEQASSWPAVSVADIEFWNGLGWVGQASCTPGARQLQRITLSATIEGHTRELVVVKRRSTQAGSGTSAWNDDMVTPMPSPGFTP